MSDLSRQLIQQTRKAVARTANTVTRSRQLTASVWKLIHDSDAHMAAQAGRIRLTYLGSMSGRDPEGPPGATDQDPERLAG